MSQLIQQSSDEVVFNIIQKLFQNEQICSVYLLDQDFEKLKRFEQMTLQKLYFDDFIYTEDTIVVAIAAQEK